MGKHSKEKEKNKINIKKWILAILIIIIVVFLIKLVLSNINLHIEEQQEIENTSITTSKTIEEEILVIKSRSDYNRIVEFSFENNILKTVKMYEQFEDKERFLEKKQNYDIADNILIINMNEQELSIETERKDLGSDIGMSYDQIYNKYLVEMIGIYEIL